MRSGKYNAPWRRKKPSLSLLRVALLSVALFAGAGLLVYVNKPVHPTPAAVGAERLRTPAMDISGEDARKVLRALQSPLNQYQGEWLGFACVDGRPLAPEIILLSGFQMSSHGPTDYLRITASLGRTGEIVFERPRDRESASRKGRMVRRLDAAETDAFRSLLSEGGFPAFENNMVACPGPTHMLQSCISGRYYGVVQRCDSPDSPSLRRLADSITAFAASGPSQSSARTE